jgi:UDP-N-acetylglucosamine--N-acetylmuramyl-(pentapeptide) pyrophosphoryl-undecaprenol N-acetylglucosamine transferase
MTDQARQLRVLIAGGGTGGHIYPGVAIAREIRRRYPNSELLFVGTERGLEKKIIPQEGFPLVTIRVAGLKGIRGVRQLKALTTVPRSLWESHVIVRHFKPEVVIGVGGYSSGPPVLVAALMGIPTMLQEQNALPGLTNRLLGRFVRKVAVAFNGCEAYFGNKVILTGNPVRPEFAEITARTETQPFTVLIAGGSQGAQAINQATIHATRILGLQLPRFRLIHQTGEKDYGRISEAYRAAGLVADVRPFFNDMPQQFAKADLLVCRSGAATLAEITVAGKPAILVPFPLATDDHQRKNAEALAQAGAAEIILQQELNGERLAARLEYYERHRDELRRMEENSRRLGRPDATARIVDLVEELVR